MTVISRVQQILGDTLQLGDRAAAMDAASPLLGALPEFDSLAVVNVIAALEEEFQITIEDDDISGQTFESLGSLSDFVTSKLN
jgi:acyl carrier protein